MKALNVAMIAICAALYAIVGYLTNLGIVSPVVGVVRFWPSVIVPAVFAALFGPWVGGIGAAIGIFFADMIHPGHGIALLSLTVGVPANFLGFFIIGYVSNKKVEWQHIALGLGICGLIAIMIVYLLNEALLSLDVGLLFLGVFIGSYIIAIIIGKLFPEWRSYQFASVLGLAVGSAWIGFGLWAYSQVFPLPLALGWERNAPFYASFLWLVWTFATEIPFLVTLGPPIIKACHRAFPSISKTKSR
ncbi:ECF transporter S component [Candidatus Bathyarchaeota archaeon]|nr:ECF transporter S component [Candidatus Bathyarchaeota archaeon]